MKTCGIYFALLVAAVSAEIRLLSPFNKQEIVLPTKAKMKCREYLPAHVDFKWTSAHGSRSYVLIVEKQSIIRREDGYERVLYDQLIKSDEMDAETTRIFYDRGQYRWSVMGRNAKGDLDRESEHNYFSIV